METMRERFTAVVTDLMDADPAIGLVLADIGVSRFQDLGVITKHPDRVVNVGIREQLMISVAAGMALEGMRPIIHSYAPFLVQRPFEQLKLDLSHQGVGAVLVSVGASYDWAEGGRTHQAPGDVAAIASLPGWRIHVPGHPDEVDTALRRAAVTTEPVYLRLSDQANRDPNPEATTRPIVLRRGSEAAPLVIAVGPTKDRVVGAAAEMDATIVYMATVRPFDGAILATMSGDTVVLVEPYLEGTSAAEVSRTLAHRPHRLASIGVGSGEFRHYGRAEQHDALHGLDESGIRRRIRSFLEDE